MRSGRNDNEEVDRSGVPGPWYYIASSILIVGVILADKGIKDRRAKIAEGHRETRESAEETDILYRRKQAQIQARNILKTDIQKRAQILRNKTNGTSPEERAYEYLRRVQQDKAAARQAKKDMGKSSLTIEMEADIEARVQRVVDEVLPLY